MQWLEIIRVLASTDKIKMAFNALSTMIGDLQDTNGKEITVHSREVFDSDLLICIRWKRDGQPGKSREGLLLAEYLEKFGMVNHEIWGQVLPVNEDQEKENGAARVQYRA